MLSKKIRKVFAVLRRNYHIATEWTLTTISEWLFRYSGGAKGLFKVWLPLIKVLGLNYAVVKSHKVYCEENSLSYQELKKYRKGVSVGLVYDNEQDPKVESVDMPDLFVSHLKNVVIHSQTDMIRNIDQHVIVNDFAYQMDDTIFANPKIVVMRQKNRLALVRDNLPFGEDIEEGIMIVTNFSNNYYHILYEVLINLFVYQQFDLPKNVPLLIDDCIKNVPSFKAIFDNTLTTDRPIKWVAPDKYYRVGSIYYLSHVNIIPPQLMDQSRMKLTDFGFDVEVMQQYKSVLLKNSKTVESPKRIFISRRGHSRRKYNEESLFEVAKKYGFERLSPENYTFEEQMSIFSNADIIIGATGAAFANLLFAKPNSVAICLMGEKIEIPIFTIGSYMADSKLIYIIGKRSKLNSNDFSFQADFSIDPVKLENILKEVAS